MRSPSEYYYLISMFIGGMIVDPSKKHPKIIYVNVIVQIFFINAFLLMALFYLLNDMPFVEKLAALQYFISMVHIIIRHYNTLLRARTVDKILKRVDKIWKEGVAEDIMKNDYKKQDDMIRKYSVFFFVIFVCPCPMVFVECLLKNWNKEVWILPLSISSPFPHSWYWSNFSFQLTSFYFALYSTWVSVNNLFILTTYSAFILKFLQQLLIQKEMTELGNRPYILYQEILQHIRELNGFLSTVYFIEMVINSMEVASRVFAFLIDMKRGDFYNLFSFGMLAILTLTTPFVLTWAGNHITTENEKLVRAIYDSSWYKNDVKTRKKLLIFMNMAARPMHLHYKFILKFELQQFTAFMQGVYSYIMLLQHVVTI